MLCVDVMVLFLYGLIFGCFLWVWGVEFELEKMNELVIGNSGGGGSLDLDSVFLFILVFVILDLV